MALPGIGFIQSHADAFFFNSTATVYRITSSTNDGAGGYVPTRTLVATIRCALELSLTGPKHDAMEGEQPTNQQLYDLIHLASVALQKDDEIVIGANRYAVVGHTIAMTNEATRRTAVKLLPA